MRKPFAQMRTERLGVTALTDIWIASTPDHSFEGHGETQFAALDDLCWQLYSSIIQSRAKAQEAAQEIQRALSRDVTPPEVIEALRKRADRSLAKAEKLSRRIRHFLDGI
jgi:hypothetical protein